MLKIEEAQVKAQEALVKAAELNETVVKGTVKASKEVTLYHGFI